MISYSFVYMIKIEYYVTHNKKLRLAVDFKMTLDKLIGIWEIILEEILIYDYINNDSSQ